MKKKIKFITTISIILYLVIMLHSDNEVKILNNNKIDVYKKIIDSVKILNGKIYSLQQEWK